MGRALVEVLRRIVPAVEGRRHFLSGGHQKLEVLEERFERLSGRLWVREASNIDFRVDRNRLGDGDPESDEAEVGPLLLAVTSGDSVGAPTAAKEVGPVEEEMAGWESPVSVALTVALG